MNEYHYRLPLTLAFIIGVGALIGVYFSEGTYQTVASTIAGSAFGLAASFVIQDIASKEQTQMIRAVTLNAEGITSLPVSFHKLKWIAHATKKASSPTTKNVEWRVVDLTKIGGAGPRFVTYSLQGANLLGDLVNYHATFIGSQSCVICAITSEQELTSTVTFDCTLPAAGVYFGVAYLTDWASDRDVTLMICGPSPLREGKLSALPPEASAAFHRWYHKVDFDVKEAYSQFPN